MLGTAAILTVPLVALALLLPRLSGASWAEVTRAIGSVPPTRLFLLTAVWFAGLTVHLRVLTAALPGLSARRALTLNLTGSAVSAVLPMGGSVGLGTNFLMMRRWGFSASQFSVYSGLVNAWHLVLKALLPAAALLLLLLSGTTMDRRVVITATVGSAALLVVLAVAAAVLLTRRGGGALAVVVERLLVLFRRPAKVGSVATRIAVAATSAVTQARSAWWSMTWGVLGYAALQLTLLWACLAATGAPLPIVVVLAAFAVERVATAVPLTPGGSGVAELAATGLLVAFGAEPASAAAGVLLYRLFVFGLEIPIGGAWLLGWWWSQRDPAGAPA